jgi:cell wall-associated NlpC family hydrolase
LACRFRPSSRSASFSACAQSLANDKTVARLEAAWHVPWFRVSRFFENRRFMMAEQHDDTRIIREEIVQVAREQIGCHYVWGAAGAVPGSHNGAWYRTNSVLLHANDPNSRNEKRAGGLCRPMLYAAWCRVDGDKVCAGRSKNTYVSALPHGQYEPQPPAHYGLFSWPRPDGLITSKNIVWGESCVGIRHFDCIGFVNWCISEVSRDAWMSINQYIASTKSVDFSAAEPCDIVTIAGKHIGIATGEGTVVHAKGTQYGVVETPLVGWSRCGRLPRRYWK